MGANHKSVKGCAGRGGDVNGEAQKLLTRLLNGDMRTLTSAQADKSRYLRKKETLKEAIQTELRQCAGSKEKIAALFAEMAKELFDMWAASYRLDMGAHLAAAEGVIRKTIDDVLSPGFVEARNGRLLVLDPTVGDGTEMLHLLRMVKSRYPGITIDLHINDISLEMMKLALELLQEFSPTHSTKNIISDNGILNLGISPGTADIILLSQTLDIVKGSTAKRRLLSQLYDALSIGGKLLVIGETPSMFTTASHLPIAAEVYFEFLFHGLNETDTEYELAHIKDNNALAVISGALHEIDFRHRAFLKLAERRF